MFENFERAKHKKLPVWAAPLMIGAIVAHVFGFGAMWVKSMWSIEKLEPPKGEIGLSVAPPPPPPPPPPPGGKKPDTPKQNKPKKIKVQEPVQPVKQEEKPPEPEASEETGEEGGVEGGVAGGVAGGSLEGVPTNLPPPPPPPPAPPQNVAPTALEASRIAGEKLIAPDDVTKTEIARSGKTKIVASVKLCINVNGGIDSMRILKSTGFPAYDQKIQREMQKWRYRPFQVNGKAAPVCTAVTFIYQQTK